MKKLIRVKLITSKKENLLLPEGFPLSVKPNYWNFIKWNLVQSTASSALGVLSTQQLLITLGTNSITASAALNWIIKDGLGLLGGVIYAGRIGNRFDENSKYYKWISAVSVNLASGLEMISPCFPSLFLPIATIGTLGKNVSALAGSASKAAIHLNLCLRNNLADVTAKSGTQATAAGLVGTLIGTLFGYSIQSYWGSVAIFSALSVCQLWACYKGLKYVDLNSLNPQRLDIIIKNFIEHKIILSTEEVSKHEKFLLPYPKQNLIVGIVPEIFQGQDGGSANIDENVEYPNENLKKYIISRHDNKVYLLYEETAVNSDIIEGYVLARCISWNVPPVTIPLEDLKNIGWEISQPFLSPTNTRYKNESSDLTQ
ncbi:unnamed protein product [Blepharisma stoltei]|uniref:Protein root UVB sensitive/RUS domain-containing protein n=1 Tax=Blepharisma stoltei TaxID=1481888 RepID=A0AAU9IKU4_9CILI|nr:unnamed protein product [Blepharisma stoltei]